MPRVDDLPEGQTPSRFRPQYRVLTDEEKDVHDALKDQAQVLEGIIDLLPEGRYKALCLTALEESIMWAVKGLTS